jgi:replicative DNA helicase
MQSITKYKTGIQPNQEPSHNCAPEIEDAFLSWVIYQPDLRLAYHWIPAAVFAQPAASAVWELIQSGAADLPTLFTSLPKKHANYLNRIAQITSFAVDLPRWVKTIVDLHTRREVYRVAVEAIALSQRPSVAPDTAIQQIISKFGEISALSEAEESLASHEQASEKFLSDLVDSHDQGEPNRYLWGWADLDRITGGLTPGQLVTVGARSSMGKSTFALNSACNMAEAGTPTLFVSLEMSKAELEAKILGRSARVSGDEFRDPRKISESTFEKLVSTAIIQKPLPLWLDDGIFRDAADIEAAILKVKNRYGQQPKVIFVDYLQLMSLDSGNEANMVQAISRLTRSLKQLAKKLGVAIVILSQLNRSVESRNDKRPMMSDLRDSGSIEQDSNLVLMLYRDAYYNPNSELGDTTEVLVVKNRGGATGKSELVFDGQYSEFKGRM